MINDNSLKDNRNSSKETKILKKGGQIMNKNLFKKVICFVIALMMVMPGLPGGLAMAEEGDEIIWDDPGAINLVKGAQKVEGFDSRWKVDLKVEGKNIEKTSDIVLVIDRSGSMKNDDRMLAAKTAAKLFINTLLSDSEDKSTRIALVSYSSDYKAKKQSSEAITVHSGFVDSSGKDALLNFLNGGNNDGTIVPFGGTFTQIALKRAKELFNGSTAESKNIVLLSDGEPTYGYAMTDYSKYTLRYPAGDGLVYNAYENPKNSSVNDFNYEKTDGNGNDLRIWKDYHDDKRMYYNSGNAAISEAGIAKGLGQTIYTVALSAGNTGNDVLEDIASPGKAHTAEVDSLKEVFKSVAGDIAYAARGAIVTDPMGEKFDLVMNNPNDYKWVVESEATPEELAAADIIISQGSITKVENVHPYTITWDVGNVVEDSPATMTYFVDIHSDAKGGVKHPTNGTTEINYTDVNNNPNVIKEFEVPEVSVGKNGSIKIVAYLVNEAGKPLAENGNEADRPDLAKELAQTYYYHSDSNILPYGDYGVETEPLSGLPGIEGYEYSEKSSLEGGNTNPTQVTINASKQNHTVYFGYVVGKYDVIYDGNGNTGGTAPTDSKKYKLNDEVIVKEQGDLVRTGYTFTGWNTSADGSGTSYASGATFNISASNVTLFAQWEKRTDLSYTVEYYKDSDTTPFHTNDAVTVTYLDEITVTDDIKNAQLGNAVLGGGYVFGSATPADKLVIGTEGNVIKVYYTTRTDIYYTVYYLDIDTEKNVANPKVVGDKVFGDTVTESAIEVSGYMKLEPTTQIIESLELEGNEIYFFYQVRDDVEYTVNYLDNDTGKAIDGYGPKVVPGKKFGEKVTEKAIDIPNYNKVGKTQETITLGVSGNIINFYYTAIKEIDTEYYIVNWVYEDPNTGEYETAPRYTEPVGNNKAISQEDYPFDEEDYKGKHNDVFGYNYVEFNYGTPFKQYVEVSVTTGSGITTTNAAITGTAIRIVTPVNLYYDIETTDITVTKIWSGGSGTRPAITINLFADGKKVDEITLNSGKTTYTFTVPKYDLKAEKQITYTVTENSVSNYSTSISGYTITNIYTGGGGGGGGKDPKPPVVIPDSEVPLAELEKFDHFAYVIGYPEGDVRPLNNITREEVAMIFYRLLTDDSRNQLLSDVNPFTDMDANHLWSNRAVSTLYNAGILSGYPDGTFRPSEPITRAEFATIAAKFDELELGSASSFTDIFGHWAEKYITSSEIKGWIKGYPDMTFKPEQDITRAEAMTLINNVLERGVPEENIHPDAIFWPDNPSTEWYYEAVMEATNSHNYVYEDEVDELWTEIKPNKVWP